MYKVQEIVKPSVANYLGEGPHWDEERQALFFISMLEHAINKYVLATGVHTKTTLHGMPSFIIPVEGSPDQFVTAVNRNFLIIQWDGKDGSEVKTVKDLGEVDPGTTHRINDGKVDPRGRLYAGTLGPMIDSKTFAIEKEKGSLYRIDGAKGAKIECATQKIGLSNGLAWDLKEKAFYYVDSHETKVRRYDYDVETGIISNMSYIFDLTKNGIEGFPDGCTIDTDGNLWVAIFNGHCVVQVDPRTGKLLQKVTIPVKQVTSVTFGGPNYDILFVTTAGIKMNEEQPPPSGSTFMVTGLGVKGHPNLNFKLSIVSQNPVMYKVQEIIKPVPQYVGEGPHWDKERQALFFISVSHNEINKYVLSTGEHTKTSLYGAPSFIIPVEGSPDQFVTAVNRNFLIIQWDGKEGSEVKVIKDFGAVDPDTNNRINDGKADPRGRLFSGTMGAIVSFKDNLFEEEKGHMYRIDSAKGGTIDRLDQKIGMSNGMAWDLKEKAFYYIDTLEFKVRRYDYDVETGDISNKSYIFDLAKNGIEGYPDGCTIDTDGNLWVALFHGHGVIKIDPRTGKMLQKVNLPVRQVTSVSFGGPNYDILFVTTAGLKGNEEQPPPGGSTYMVTGLGVKGHPNVNFKL